MSAHTAGPWAIHFQNRVIVPVADAYKAVSVDGRIAEASDGAKCLFLFADPRDGLSEDETYANAFLAAAAPEMLQVLQLIVNAEDYDAIEAAKHAAIAAIAKVEGKSA